MQERQRQAKQKYLRDNILDKDYDAQEFMDFCENYKGSMDIDAWSLQQLSDVSIVQKFIKTSTKAIQNDPFQYNSNNSTKQQPIDWDTHFQPSTHNNTNQNNFNLNLVDLDFLQSMGSQSSPHPPPKKPVVQNKPSINKKSDDPSAILARLNDKSSNQFISTYNAFAMNNREKEKPTQIQPPKLQKKQSDEQPSPTVVRKEPQQQILKLPSQKDTSTIVQNFKDNIKCKIFSQKPRLEGDYQALVTGHQIVNPNPFVPNFVLYTLTIKPLGTEVKRRLKDFQTLRNLLKRYFPNVQIPHFQRYGRRLSETEPATIKKQKLFLESFLNGLLMNKKIRCKILDDFFLCPSLDTLKKILRDFQKLDRPKAIEDLYTHTGRIDIQYSSQNKKYVSQQELYFQYLETNFGKLKELYDQLTYSLSNTVRILNQISDLYSNLRDSTKNINGLMEEKLKSTSLQTTFDRVSDLHKHWGLSVRTQAKLTEVEVRHLFRYETINLDTIRQIVKTSNNVVEAYDRRDNKSQAAREQYQFNKRLNDYKSGLQNPSKNTTVLRYQSGYWLNSTVEQIKRYFSELSDKVARRFRIYSDLQLNICNDLMKNWEEFKVNSQLTT